MKNPNIVFAKARMMNKNPYVAMVDRITYLKEQHDYYCDIDDCIAPLYAQEYLEEIVYLMKEYLRRKKLKIHANILSEDQIEAARQFPVNQLIEFHKGKVLCFNHKDTRPSLAWNQKHNLAHCFVCNKSFNAIDILMKKEGYSFKDAVRELI